MKFHETPLKGAYVVEPEPFFDARGGFARIFCQKELAGAGLGCDIVQANRSVNAKAGCVRGLHYQSPPKAETKMVTCIRGAVRDVIVDLRRGSSTFLQWFGKTLTAENMLLIYAPAGFAHGFQTLEDNSELLYLHTEFYSPDHEDGIRHDDPLLGIDWPLEPTGVSDRDRSHPLLTADFKGICP
ncbi:MAG: dTDP-4-dehydrorhamnose 3,5-epimerase [Thermodesulfobacteriota bacterium]|nr:dTDP-4-dehydrorhamnose 3,5-epimerase [Thermodesulfobacteriota bacterium]